MTRDEAIYKIARCFYDSASGRWDQVKDRAARLVETFVALGMLKLDEPKDAWGKFKEVMVNEFDYSPVEECRSTTLNDVKASLERAGLKIVEK